MMMINIIVVDIVVVILVVIISVVVADAASVNQSGGGGRSGHSLTSHRSGRVGWCAKYANALKLMIMASHATNVAILDPSLGECLTKS